MSIKGFISPLNKYFQLCTTDMHKPSPFRLCWSVRNTHKIAFVPGVKKLQTAIKQPSVNSLYNTNVILEKAGVQAAICNYSCR